MLVDETIFHRIRNGDLRARDEFFNANTGLIWACVNRYAGLLDKEDLFQLGAIGLLKAIDRFDPSYGVSFSTYAVPLIMGEMRRYLRDTSQVKVSRRLKEIALSARKLAEEKRSSSGREPSAEEVAKEMGLDVDVLCQALDATSPVLYLDDLAAGQDLAVSDYESAVEEPFLERFDLNDALGRLEPQLRSIIEGRFFAGKTQYELSEELGISQAHVSRLEKKALFILRRFLEGAGGEFKDLQGGNTTGRREKRDSR
ncbi:MAG TPA: sigma-70 family RNA polymerase sigma factor [Firmicutes bacterium]|uniref:RNA polymerase sigma factor n=1 Tax=Candidatus Fermentithermobacillus carboniphilus TaxID=3085328 RepID=A0AAT9LCU2_9FIRM|nr:MAG: sigma-70 family RNA polymerase sigma factor [Candidatus Fermentithermobacillus carboniphilus]HHW17955.1 sigma-70 family RNA polymerase sigma factor [Candidatus Fermentithermobacillaceae bacterium]